MLRNASKLFQTGCRVFIPTIWPVSGQYFIALVGSPIFGLGLENFPYKISKFSTFALRGQKKSH